MKRLDTNNSTKTTPSKSEDNEFDFPVQSVTTNTPSQSSTDILNDTPSLSEDNPSNVKASQRSIQNRQLPDYFAPGLSN